MFRLSWHTACGNLSCQHQRSLAVEIASATVSPCTNRLVLGVLQMAEFAIGALNTVPVCEADANAATYLCDSCLWQSMSPFLCSNQFKTLLHVDLGQVGQVQAHTLLCYFAASYDADAKPDGTPYLCWGKNLSTSRPANSTHKSLKKVWLSLRRFRMSQTPQSHGGHLHAPMEIFSRPCTQFSHVLHSPLVGFQVAWEQTLLNTLAYPTVVCSWWYDQRRKHYTGIDPR